MKLIIEIEQQEAPIGENKYVATLRSREDEFGLMVVSSDSVHGCLTELAKSIFVTIQNKKDKVDFKRILSLFDKYTFDELVLLKEAVLNDFEECRVRGSLVSKDWCNSSDIYQQAINTIGDVLYKRSDSEGFPDAIKFFEDNIEDFENCRDCYSRNIKGIALWLIDKRVL